MQCPFLSETQVHSCRLASVRKMIPQASLTSGERCTSPQYAECAAFRELQSAEGTGAAQCPYHEDALMQFCSAAPVQRMVPWSEAAVSKCGSGAFHFCDSYLEVTEASAGRTMDPSSELCDELSAPAALYYSRNHMWLHRSEDALCHIGIDAFCARMLGTVERVDFLTTPGAAGRTRHLPSVVLRAGGHDWQIVFPRPMTITACNLVLRRYPERLTSDPYGRGWLFAGTGVELEGLVTGADAAQWTRSQTVRLNEFVQRQGGAGTLADGGMFEAGLLCKLVREDGLQLYIDFLSPTAEAAITGAGFER
jgi:glycine cleavage system H lipoate-binding protein